jgi:cell pole-organizing protein PopZ
LRREEPLPKTGTVPAPVAEAVPKPAIISPSAGRQVAAAFGELSEAFAARSKKTFDDLAEQMLRPMLQDWLDNNLPILVERLVREEIERVARGVE